LNESTHILRHFIWRAVDFKRRLQSQVFDYCHFGRYLGRYEDSAPEAERGVNPSQPTAVWILRYIFGRIYRIQPNEVLVDVGCGQGRVIMWWLKAGYRNKIYGIEIDEAIAEKARGSLAKYSNVKIITGDALEKLPPEGTMFYLFNPFQLKIALQFRKLIAERYLPGTVMVYYFPRWIEVFRGDARFEVTEYSPIVSKLTGGVKAPWTAVVRRVN